MKTEPRSFSWQDLIKLKDKTTHWDGVRNYLARNHMKSMKVGDLVFFYHSIVKPTAIFGVARVVKEAYPDFTQFNPESKYFDEKSTEQNPRWFMVDIKAEHEFSQPITLEEIRHIPGLGNMELVRTGSRLSVQPVREEEWNIIRAFRK